MAESSEPTHVSAGWSSMKTLPIRLLGSERRVILLPFVHSFKLQVEAIFDLVERMTDAEAGQELERVMGKFRDRHQDFTGRTGEHYSIARRIAGRECADSVRRRLLGAYFTMEYAIEAAALFNPSMVPHPDQTGLAAGALRFVMSLRAVGEGHVSSVVFRTGRIDGDGEIVFDPINCFAARASIHPDHCYQKELFTRTIERMDVTLSVAAPALAELQEEFTLPQLETAVAKVRSAGNVPAHLHGAFESMLWLARSNYELRAAPKAPISDLLIYPNSDNEAHGIEDMRLARWVDDDGAVRYFGTYTAYNGARILPMLMETKDFRTLAVHTLNGACAQNKGMVFFPRRINGHYAMISRIDGRNLYFMLSDNVHFWESADLLASPKYPWEYRLIGNCGAPMETSEGWLLLTHGVGPMRQYSIGAMLLDRNNPRMIRGRLRQPLIEPTAEEAGGYVPNVVYTCGGLIHGCLLILPYSMSDQSVGFVSVQIDEILNRLLKDGA